MKFRPCFFALLYLFYLTAFAERIVTLPEKNLKPFIQKYCSGCHGAEKQKAKVRLDNLSLAVQTPLTAQHWQDVLDTLNAGDMPPEKKEQPSTEELSLILRDLTEGLKKARIALSDQGKKISMRRLNRREYSGAIKHLFGFGVNQEDIPEDDPTDSYDTIGSQQFSRQIILKCILLSLKKLLHRLLSLAVNLRVK